MPPLHNPCAPSAQQRAGCTSGSGRPAACGPLDAAPSAKRRQSLRPPVSQPSSCKPADLLLRLPCCPVPGYSCCCFHSCELNHDVLEPGQEWLPGSQDFKWVASCSACQHSKRPGRCYQVNQGDTCCLMHWSWPPFCQLLCNLRERRWRASGTAYAPAAKVDGYKLLRLLVDNQPRGLLVQLSYWHLLLRGRQMTTC